MCKIGKKKKKFTFHNVDDEYNDNNEKNLKLSKDKNVKNEKKQMK